MSKSSRRTPRDMVVKLLNMHRKITNSCSKSGHSVPSHQVEPTTSKRESSNIIEREKRIIAKDDKSDELDKRLNSVSDEEKKTRKATVNSVNQSENDELEMLLKEIRHSARKTSKSETAILKLSGIIPEPDAKFKYLSVILVVTYESLFNK